MRKPRTALDYLERLQRLRDSTLDRSRIISSRTTDKGTDTLPSLEERIKCIFDTINSDKRPVNNMLFFVMYDIESNKVRYNVVKYLQKKGCTRIQKSIFLQTWTGWLTKVSGQILQKYSQCTKIMTVLLYARLLLNSL